MGQKRETAGFILRKVDYGERDIIATVFGRETGKFSAIAKNARGSKRRFGGGLQPMRLLEITYARRSSNDTFARLDEIDVLQDFPALEANFAKITIGSYATELVREILPEGDPFEETFDLLADFYRRLSETGTGDADVLAMEVVLRHFEWELLRLEGILPSVDRCFRCGEPREAFDKIRAMRTGEGIVCADCIRTGEAVGVLAPRSMAVLDYFRRPAEHSADALADPDAFAQARRFIDASVEQVVGKELKSRPMLETVLEDTHES